MSKITKSKSAVGPVTAEERRSIASSIASLGDHIEQVANDFVGVIDRDPETISKMLSEFPQIHRFILVRLERVGRKQLHCRGFFECGVAASAVARLPYDIQEKIFDGASIPVVEEAEPGRLVTVLKKYNEISKPSLVFSGPRILSVAEQTQAIKAAPKSTPRLRWQVRDGGLYVYENPLSLAETEAALKQLQQHATANLQASITKKQIAK